MFVHSLVVVGFYLVNELRILKNTQFVSFDYQMPYNLKSNSIFIQNFMNYLR